MGPVLVQKLELFEKKKVARREIEKSLHMYVHVRRHRALLAAKRAAEEAARLAEEERLRKEAEAARIAEEARLRAG